MKKLLTLVLILIFAVFGLMFGSRNEVPVVVDYLWIRTEWPLGVNLMLFFLAGVIISGLLVYLSMWVSLKRRIAALKKSHTTTVSRESTASGSQLTLHD